MGNCLYVFEGKRNGMLKLHKIQMLLELMCKDKDMNMLDIRRGTLIPKILNEASEHSSIKLEVLFAIDLLDDLLERDVPTSKILQSLKSISCTHKNTLINQIIAYEIKKTIINKYSYDLSMQVL